VTVSLHGSSASGALLQPELRFVEVIPVRLLYGLTVASLGNVFLIRYFLRGVLSRASERVEELVI